MLNKFHAEREGTNYAHPLIAECVSFSSF